MAPPAWRSRKKGSLNFVINFFHAFNFILFVCGWCLVGVAVWSLLYKQDYTVLIQTALYSLAPWALLVAGVATVILPILGSCSVSHRNNCLLLLYIFSLLLTLVLEVTIGGLAWLYRGKVEFDLSHTLEDSFSNYNLSPEHTTAIDSIQQRYKCCGAKTFEEWVKREWLRGAESKNYVPDSCCKTVSLGCGASYHPSNIPYTGCMHKLSEELGEHLVVVGASSLGVSVVPLLGLVLGSYLYIKLRDPPYPSYTQASTRPL